jgi:acetyltransferase-like isoleucine patch superfamily enzyme
LSAKVAREAGFLSYGPYTYGNPTVHVFPGDTGTIAVGKFTSIGPGVELFVGGEHRTDWVTTFPLRLRLELPGALSDGHPRQTKETTIGHDVWIGAGSTILSEVAIGNGAVIGAKAVVADHVRPYAVVAGNPAVEIRRRFDDEVVEQLLEIEWWNWPIEQIRESVDRLSDSDVAAFIKGYGQR